MATTTTNYGLKKPAGTENYNVEDQNGNMDIIDTKIKENADALTTHKAEKTSKTLLGHVKIGAGIDVDINGVISVPPPVSLTVYSDLNYYVNSVSGSDNNDGLSTGTAFKTIQKAVDMLGSGKIFANYALITCAPGTYAVPTGDSLQKAKFNQISFMASGTSADTTLTGNIDINDLSGRKIRVLRFKLSDAYGVVGLNNPGDIYLSGVDFTGTVLAVSVDGANNVTITTGCKLKGMAAAIDLKNIGTVKIDGSTTALTGDYGCILLTTCGAVEVNGVTLAVTSPASNYTGLSAYSGTVVHAKGIKGALGASPMFLSRGSVIMLGANTITGAANVKEEGGQIYV